MSTDYVGRWPAHAQREQSAPPVADRPPTAHEEALEFVRFCYRRRRVAWPALYDEMCAVAARGLFRGLGYTELSERGISFCLGELTTLSTLAERVVREDEALHGPPAATGVAMMLVRAGASG